MSPDERAIDTGTDELRVNIRAAVAYIMLNRPERRNALTPTMIAALARVLAVLDRDDDIGCIVLFGAGHAFCAGGDVIAMASTTAADAADDSAGHEFERAVQSRAAMQRAVTGLLWETPKPTIAAINGAAAGAGLSIALACDLRYGSPDAFLTTAFAKVGLSGDYGATWFLTQLVGPSKARELFFFADRIDANEAQRLGLLNDVLTGETFMDEVISKAERLAAGPRLAFGYMKENLNRSIGGELHACLDAEAVSHLRSAATDDHRDAARAFAEKRTPSFRGR